MQERESLTNSEVAYEPLPGHDSDDPVTVQVTTTQGGFFQRGKIVYVCFLLFGLGTLLPWNFFITADTYWQYKFRNVSEGNDDWKKRETQLQRLFDPLQVFLSQVTCFIFLFLNALFSHHCSQRLRLVGSLTLMLQFFVLTAALVKVNTDSWQKGFFILTLVTIFFMSALMAIFQGSVYGIAGRFPEKYINGVTSGQALGGVFSSLARIASVLFALNDLTSAFIYFLVAVAVMMLTLVAFVCVSRTPFFRYYAIDRQTHREELDAVGSKRNGLADSWRVFKVIWTYGVTVGGAFIVTLSLFPVVCVRVLSTSTNLTWADKYFQPVATFFLFNCGDYLGRVLAEFFLWPKRESSLLHWCAILRLGFVPLILLCNHTPDSVLPSIFRHDAWYMVFILAFGLSNGYIVSLCIMYGPKVVPHDDAEKAAGIMAAMVGLGLLLGSLASFVFSLII